MSQTTLGSETDRPLRFFVGAFCALLLVAPFWLGVAYLLFW